MATHLTEQESPVASKSVDGLATQFLSKVFTRKEEPRRSKRSQPPWELWELDKEFFRALSQWSLTHPMTNLDRVLKKIADGLDNHRDLLDLIPEGPFPARGLITALGYLLKLGVMISHAKADVHDFAKDVIRWVGAVKSAFELQGDGQFTRLAWWDLRHMRDLINEVCTWAVERLDDRRWARIGNGLKIQEEIQEFNKRIAGAQALFQDLSAINLAKGIDAILAHVQKLVQRQRIIIYEIRKIRQTQDKQFAEIMGRLNAQSMAAERERFLKKALAGYVVADPTYVKQGKRPCDPATRVEVLAEIDKWINDVSPGSQNFLWLTGDPGCGKSAVTASISRDCKKQNTLWAQFFINRNNVETTNPNLYFPSIARQLADHSPAVAVSLYDAFLSDRTLIDGISTHQAARLFIDSVGCASRLEQKRPVVVVIDGLDETDRKRLKETAKIFSTLFAALSAYNNVKVFISSRTENDITNSFILPSHNKHVKRLHLHTADPSSIRDVSLYIKQNLLKLVEVHDLNWAVWPGDGRSEVLGERASGLFIWAVTAIKFIEERLDTDGTECLNKVLDMLTADVLYDVNALYMLILEVTHGAHPSEWELERFRRIIGAIVFLQEPLSINDLARLLDLRETPSSDAVDITHFVRRFRTILVTGADIIDGSTVPRIHKSVFEFITSDGADPRFHVDLEHAHLELGVQCLAQLGHAHVSINEHVLALPFRYASRFWSSHLSQANAMTPNIVCIDCRHSPASSRLSLHHSWTVSTALPIKTRYSSINSQIHTIQGDHTLPWDASSGVNLSGHTGRVTCLAFSPDGKQILSGSRDKSIKAWDATNGRWLRTLVEYSSPISAIAFSPDGKFIVSGSWDPMLCLWNSSTGALIGQPFSGHDGSVKCVAFSPDCQQFVSGSDDRTCILWNVATSREVGKPWVGHNNNVVSIVFSASGQRVCSGDDGGYCTVWDATTGEKLRGWQSGQQSELEFKLPRSISFSPQSDDVIAVGSWSGIEIRSNNQQWKIPISNYPQSLCFSPDGKQISFVTDGAAVVADIDWKRKTTRAIKKGKYDSGYGPKSFSPDLGYFAYTLDKAVHVCAVQHNKESLDVTPAAQSPPAITTTIDGANHEFIDIVSDLHEVQQNNTTVNNRRLNEIKWYESKVKTPTSHADAMLELLMLTDKTVIAAYEDGPVSVWNRYELT